MDAVEINLDFSQGRRVGEGAVKPPHPGVPAIPSFFLYGEAPREIGHHFLHLEPLADRSQPNDWNIRPHAHENLSHVFFVSDGAGEMRTDRGHFAFDAPAALIVPARTIHGFTWSPDTAGRVVTVSDAYLGELLGRERQFGDLFTTPGSLSLGAFPDDTETIGDCLHVLGRELAWNAPAHGIAVEARLLILLVTILRVARREDMRGLHPGGRDGELVARFREAVEDSFRTACTIDGYAERLAVSTARLRIACLNAARSSPHRILSQRVVLEAKRLLLYSNMTVSEAAYFLGFDDPAYFSRVFRQHTGLSPRAFRARNAPSPAETDYNAG
jgi:AraC family transcriptional activator of pobA